MDVYRIKSTLLGVEPPVWRRVEVPADTTLDALHDILQIAMGWENSHLHLFIVNGAEYGATDPELGVTIREEREAVLAKLVNPGERLTYVYDFGDDWNHELLIEKLLPAELGTHYPRCAAGARACPPEDCGGPCGYRALLEALADPEAARADEDRAELLDWLGDDGLDPEAFDLKSINKQLGQV